jgi:cell wall-associated NlpC family hydrolase
MRSGAAAVAVLATVVTSTVAAQAATSGHSPYPSQQQVDHARAQVQQKLKGVKAIEAALAQAQTAAQNANTKAEIAAEQYNGAMWKLGLAQDQSRRATEAAKVAQKRVADQRDNIGRLAAQSYQNSTDFTSLNAVLGGATPTEMLQRAGVVQMANAPMQAAFKEFQTLSDAAKVAQAKARQAELAQQALASQAAAAKDAAAGLAAAAAKTEQSVATQRTALLNQLAQAQHVSVALATERQNALEAIARERAAARARAEAIARAKQEAQQNSGGSGSGGGSYTPPPNVRGIQRVIDFARAQLGKPYVWAGAGPDVWDCSGLTMMAFRQIGIYLPHYAASQYTMGTPVPVSQAQPGDLLFWTSDGSVAGIHHVALYIGNGTFIEAPHTGANVRYDTLYGLDGYPDFAARM